MTTRNGRDKELLNFLKSWRCSVAVEIDLALQAVPYRPKTLRSLRDQNN